MKEKDSRETQKIVEILREQLKSYSASTILSALDEIVLLAAQEAGEDKPVRDGDHVEYLPADAWTEPEPENGYMKRTVKEGKRGQVKITHADGSTQTHPRTAKEREGYVAGTDIYRDSDYIYFPPW